MRVTAKVDYAVRAMVELVGAEATSPRKAEHISQAQDIPVRFLLNILGELKVAKLVESRRGADGGYWLARPAAKVSVADVIRAVEGPLAAVHGVPPELLVYRPPAEPLRDVWLGARAALRRILEHVSLADIASGSLPPQVRDELDQPGAWERR
ncbi:MAG: Rrf2 family transcriptional regulator [Actinomycetota bacterium]|nr:Rrf2 family transcriptional regulator [Actinomycetota bacterium]